MRVIRNKGFGVIQIRMEITTMYMKGPGATLGVHPGWESLGRSRKKEGECARQGSESRQRQRVACKPHVICVEMAPET